MHNMNFTTPAIINNQKPKSHAPLPRPPRPTIQTNPANTTKSIYEIQYNMLGRLIINNGKCLGCNKL